MRAKKHKKVLINHSSSIIVGALAVVLVGALTLSQGATADATTNLLPIANGSYLQWTRVSSGSQHFTAVDESSCNGTSDYVRETTVGERDSFEINISAVPNGATITEVSITPCASRNGSSGGGSSVMKLFYRLNGTNSADFGNYVLTGTTPVNLTATAIGGLSIMKDGASTLEIGAVYASGNRGVRLSRIATSITYSVSVPPSVTTGSASLVGASSATLNGSANPAGTATSGYFRYDTTNPGSCNDSFGIRMPGSGGTDLGSGTSSVAYANAISGLAGGTTYYFCALASSSSGVGYGNVLTFSTTQTIPTAPSNLIVAGISGSEVGLVWQDNSSNEDGFTILRSDFSFGPFVQVGTTTANVTNFTDSGLQPDRTYYYRVIAYNVVGNSPNTSTEFGITATVAPIAPTNLLAIGGGTTTTVWLQWNQSSTNELGFKVERSDGVAYAEIGIQPINTTGFMDAGLAPGSYSYRVRAYNTIGNSPYSNIASTTIQ